MEINEIQKVADEWHKVTWDVIEFKDPGVDEISKLFQKTCEIIENYRKENFVPKEICSILLKITDFGWWVSGLEETPLHEFYQELLSLISALNKYFFTHDGDVKDIIETIEKISEGEFKYLEIKYE